MKFANGIKVYADIIIHFSDKKVDHERQIYGFLDLLGDFGGVQGVLQIIASLLLGSVSQHAFLSKAISKLYLARTKDASIFMEKKSEKAKSKRYKQKKLSR